MRKILVTAALPYANGPIHIGHLVEYLQADIWTRFQRLQGHECVYICADDTHGTPIMINARKQGITPEELIGKSKEEHLKDFNDFHVAFDHFDSTHSEENKMFSEEIYSHMKEKGHIEVRSIEQAFCVHDDMFLPDRFVKGECPKCGAKDQYGDACEICSTTYSALELKSPYCTICQNTPTAKNSDHIFFQLNHFKDFLNTWVKEHNQPEVYNKLKEWLENDLKDWDISRDKPYFGFEIPGFKDKYFYVWVDAPIGYISSTYNWAKKNNKNFEEYWKSEETELYHFIGKDIVYFHSLFWPAMLFNAGFRTPNKVFVHGFLKVNGEKMSKSRGTFLMARTYLNHLDPMYLRYYYASKLTAQVEDIDLNFEDFAAKINSELVGKISNLASRGAQMLSKKIDGRIGTLDEEGLKLVREAQEKGDEISKYYEERSFSKVIQAIREIADEANRYFDEKQPWKLIKEDSEETRKVLTTTLNLFRTIAIYLKPILPTYALNVEKLLNENEYRWEDSKKLLENHKIGEFSHLAQRIQLEQFEKMIEEQKQNG
ncbi:MAG: methionine--tRNA ligase [Bdellovibrionales bacterium]|nr:methionine--tRNA ligase [Bdellovibrionales bacterium]